MKLKYIFTVIFVAIFMAFVAITPTHAQEKASDNSATFLSSFEPYVATDRTDDRVMVLQKYLEKNDSPLAPYAPQFIAWADYYHMPWELLPAISGVESTFGKEVPCTNAFGWNVYGDNTYCFASYPDAIHIILKTLREEYVDKWKATDVYAIGSYYAASSTWADHVTYFINDIRAFKLAYENQNNALSISL